MGLKLGIDQKENRGNRGNRRAYMKKGKKGKKGKIVKVEEVIVKRGRGRPRKHPIVLNKILKKRGRPRKDRTVIENIEVEPLVPTKIGKHLGYCPECSRSISTLDIGDKKGIYTCYNCNNGYKLNKLNLEPNVDHIGERPRSKKEYYDMCLVVGSSAPMHPPEIISKKELGEIVSSNPDE